MFGLHTLSTYMLEVIEESPEIMRRHKTPGRFSLPRTGNTDEASLQQLLQLVAIIDEC